MKTVGVIGGMGPQATLRFCQQVIDLTQAQRDQDHIPMIIYNNTQIPDRSLALTSEKSNPLTSLERTLKAVDSAGADFMVMPCNTAHYYYPQLKCSTKKYFINMIEETAEHIKQNYQRDKVCILGTTGTIKMELYQHELSKREISYCIVNDTVQETYIMPAIRMIKAGKNSQPSNIIWDVLSKIDADIIIAGCTEIPLVMQGSNIIDPSYLLAKKAVAIANED